jgi:hypothetical protein
VKATTRLINTVPEHLDAETLDGLMANVREALGELHYHQYQQIAALFSPRPGLPDSDAVPFTQTTADELQKACHDDGIKSAVFGWLEDGVMTYSVVVARADKGLNAAERQARKTAKQRGARLYIYR